MPKSGPETGGGGGRGMAQAEQAHSHWVGYMDICDNYIGRLAQLIITQKRPC